MKIIEAASPNHDNRNGVEVDILLLHYTGMQSGAEALERMRDSQAKVAAHYMVEEDGRVFQLVDEAERAWHAGVSSWKGEGDINARSIGIEIVNPGHEFGYRAFPDAQIDAVLALSKAIIARHGIAPARVLGHSDVAPARKADPGEKFPWARFAHEGLAWPPYRGTGEGEEPLGYYEAIEALRNIGYGFEGDQAAAAILAFQRRFCSQALGQFLDPTTKAAIKFVSGFNQG